MRSVLLSLVCVCAQAAIIPLTGRLGPVTLNSGDSILLEYQQFSPERWTSMGFVRMTATTPAEIDYAATALQVQFESPDGSNVLDVGVHQMERFHFYAASRDVVFYDFYAGRMVAQHDPSREDISRIMDSEKRLRVRITNLGIPLTFGHGYEQTGPLNYQTFAVTGQTLDGFGTGAGDAKAAWLITQDLPQNDEAAVPEPSSLALVSLAFAAARLRA